MAYRLTIRDGVSPQRPGNVILEADNDEFRDWEVGDWLALPSGQIAAVLDFYVTRNGVPEVTLFVGRQP
jgi:hypothetical protein